MPRPKQGFSLHRGTGAVFRFEQFDLRQHGDLIIDPTLAYSNRAEVRWLFEVYGRAHIVT